ncbi:MAG TPA: hypothetical protein VJ960_09495 [Oceanipulchritudo sp.]|nr:hypothetical protein [Oceanipulchritudo sp.]
MIRFLLILAILLQAFGGLLRACPIEDCVAGPGSLPTAFAGVCCPETNQDAGLPGGHGRCLCPVSVTVTYGVADRVMVKPSVSAPESIQVEEDEPARGQRVINQVLAEAGSGWTMSPSEWRSRIRVRLI